MYADFMGRAGDEIFNQLAKWQAMSAGELTMPVVLRVSVGAKYGAQHSQDWTALVHHIPGLKVVYPVTPYDAKGMMNAALAGTDPVVFFESQKVYDFGEMFVEEGVPEGLLRDRAVRAVGQAGGQGPDDHHAGAGACTPRWLPPSELQKRFGVSAEVIDLRAATPLNYEPLVESVRKTGKVLLVSRRRRARQRHADRRREPDAALLRRSRRAAGGHRIAQLDHAGGGARSELSSRRSAGCSTPSTSGSSR